jgi:hypothetical protein
MLPYKGTLINGKKNWHYGVSEPFFLSGCISMAVLGAAKASIFCPFGCIDLERKDGP